MGCLRAWGRRIAYRGSSCQPVPGQITHANGSGEGPERTPGRGRGGQICEQLSPLDGLVKCAELPPACHSPMESPGVLHSRSKANTRALPPNPTWSVDPHPARTIAPGQPAGLPEPEIGASASWRSNPIWGLNAVLALRR